MQRKQSSSIQTKQTASQPFSETSPYGECSLVKVFPQFEMLLLLWAKKVCSIGPRLLSIKQAPAERLRSSREKRGLRCIEFRKFTHSNHKHLAVKCLLSNVTWGNLPHCHTYFLYSWVGSRYVGRLLGRYVEGHLVTVCQRKRYCSWQRKLFKDVQKENEGTTYRHRLNIGIYRDRGKQREKR